MPDPPVEMPGYRVIACPRLLSEKDRLDVVRPTGGTLADLLRSIGWRPDPLHARVFLDGELVPDARWEAVLPQDGQTVLVRVVPTGGNGGKDAGRIVAMIAVLAAAIAVPYLAPVAWGIGAGTIGGALVTAGISIGGSLAVGALIPPAPPQMETLSGFTNTSNTFALTGTANQLLPYGVIPRVYGRHRMFPPLAAHVYTEVAGDAHYLRALFLLGPGPLALSDFKIGENTLALFEEVEVEVRQGAAADPPHQLYPEAVLEEPLSLPVTQAGGPLIRTSRDGATELSIDVTFPALFEFHPDAGILPWTVQLDVHYRRQGETDWIQAGGRVAAPASLTTALDGAQNDLLFTAVGPGSWGNNCAVTYLDLGDLPTEVIEAAENGPNAIVLFVGLRKVAGVYSTALQIKAAVDTAQVPIYARDEWGNVLYAVNEDGSRYPLIDHYLAVADHLAVALAPANDGTGSVSPMALTALTGGLDFVPGLSITAASQTPVSVPLRWTVPTPGLYEVRLTRLNPDEETVQNVQVFSASYWTALRTVRAGRDLVPAGMVSIALRVKATNQLNGTLDQFNCLASSILPDWNGTAWVARETNNPAAIFRDVHQGAANARPKPDSRMDLPTIQGFHARCAALGFTFNAVIDFRSTVAELARQVLAAGRGTPGWRDGRVSVVEDLPQLLPAQVFTPRNSWGFRGTKVFVDLPQALKARFVNPETLQQDERIVVADGYGVTGPDGLRRDAFGAVTTDPEATVFESLEAGLGVTDPAQVFALTRYHLAVLQLRPETYTLHCDFEQLACLRGDLVMVQHDVPLFGLLSGRVTALTTNALGQTTSITLDDSVVMEAGQRYGVRLRLQDGSQVQREVQTVEGAQSTLTFLSPV